MPRAATTIADEGEDVEQAEDSVERLPDGALDPAERRRLERQRAGHVRELCPLRSGRRGAEAHGEGIGARDTEAFRIGPADDERLAGRAGQGPFGDADDAQRQHRAVGRGGVDDRVESQAVARGDARGHDDGAAGVECRERRRTVAGDEVQPAVGREVGADHRGTVGPDPVDGQRERADRAHRGDPGRDQHVLELVEAAREDRGQDEVARHDVGDPGSGRRPGVLPDASERHDHREADRQRPDRQRGTSPVTQERSAREPLLEPRDQPERQARDPRERRQDERHDQRHGQQDAIHEQRAHERRPARRHAAR